MKKKAVGIFLSVIMLLTSLTFFNACGTDDLDDIDQTKTQVYVANIDGGTGHAWYEDSVKRFEEYYADTPFEEGKMGVQVQKLDSKNISISSLNTSSHYVYFLERVYYNNYISTGDFLNITDMVKNEKLPGEDKTIADKLSSDLKSALTAIDGNYYCLPLHQVFCGVTYNKYMFDTKGLYFADDVSEAPVKNTEDPRYGFVLTSDAKKSTGPDALYGTDDDGLPSSIEEYKKLCDCMVHFGITPFTCYAFSYHYTQYLLQSLWANLAGYDQMMLSFSFDSERYGNTDIVALNEDGSVKMDNGKPVVIKDQRIDSTNGYLLNRQLSRYYALDFLQYIFNPSKIRTYMTSDSLSANLSHTDAQLNFLRGEAINKPIGMLIEGNYWEGESRDANNFETMKNSYPSYYNKMDYRFMPMPVQYEGRVTPIGTVGEEGITRDDGIKQTVLDSGYFYGFINAHAIKNADNPAVAERVSKLFLQFLYTDESLQASTLANGISRNVDYELTTEQYNKLSSYGKSLYDLKRYGNVVVPISDSSLYVKNMATFGVASLDGNLWASGVYSYPINAFRDGKSLNDYFKLICNYHDKNWWGKLH